jgi:hypothetical protein
VELASSAWIAVGTGWATASIDPYGGRWLMMLGLQRSRNGYILWTPVVGVEVIGMITPCRLDVLLLELRRRQVLHLHCMAFFLAGVMVDAAPAA